MAHSAFQIILEKSKWANCLLRPIPGRMELSTLGNATWPLRECRALVFRNHGFESLVSLLESYCAFAGRKFLWTIGAYDDSLSFTEFEPHDVVVLWIDRVRYPMDESGFTEWFAGRVGALRKKTSAPVLAVTVGLTEFEKTELSNILPGEGDVFLCPCDDVFLRFEVLPFDERLQSVSGSRLSSSATMLLARELGCRWLPAALGDRIKAVAVDLDNTLYSGVLGEDGAKGVTLTRDARELQTAVKGCIRDGVLATVISKNEPGDIEEMFAERRDFPLELNDFLFVGAAWSPKAELLRPQIEKMRIGSDAVLFVDDNPGEIEAMTEAFPDIHALLATPETINTALSLQYYPGVFRFKKDELAGSRAADLQKNAERETVLTNAADENAYFESMRIVVALRVNSLDSLPRLAELCRKTNQFNLALRRFSETELNRRMHDPDCSVVAIDLSDRLMDSGSVGLVAARRVGAAMHIDEVCISCRALGRRLESVMLTEAIKALPFFPKMEKICFHIEHGPRNAPGLRWLGDFSGHDTSGIVVEVEAAVVRDYVINHNIVLVK